MKRVPSLASISLLIATACSSSPSPVSIADSSVRDAASTPDSRDQGHDATTVDSASDGAHAADRFARDAGSDVTTRDTGSDAHDSGPPCIEAGLATDPTNCGACGHNCQGGACSESACLPFRIAPATSPRQLALDDAHVYWVEYAPDGGAILRAPLSGVEDGGVGTPIAAGLAGPYGLAIRGGRAYWGQRVDPGAVQSVSVDGGTPSLVASGVYCFEVVTNDASVFCSDLLGNRVARAPITGDASFETVASGNTPLGLALNRDAIFYAFYVDGGVGRAPFDGGAPDPLVRASAASEVALDRSYVYYGREGQPSAGGGIYRVPLDGGAPFSYGVPTSGYWIVVDAENVYWSDNTGAIYREPIDGLPEGGTPTTFAPTTAGAQWLAIDATSVYWGSPAGIMRRAK